MIVSVSVYPKNDSMPFKINFPNRDEANAYCEKISNRCDFIVMEFPNEVYREID